MYTYAHMTEKIKPRFECACNLGPMGCIRHSEMGDYNWLKILWKNLERGNSTTINALKMTSYGEERVAQITLLRDSHGALRFYITPQRISGGIVSFNETVAKLGLVVLPAKCKKVKPTTL